MNKSSFNYLTRNSKWLIPTFAAIVLLTLAIAVDRVIYSRFALEERTTVHNEASKLRASIESTINSNLQAVQGLVLVLNAFPEPSQEQFAFFAAPLFNQNTLLRNIAAAPDMVIKYMYPLEGNEAAIGLDFRATPAQKEAAERAERTGQLVLAGPVNLKQGGQGFIGRIPVFTYNKETNTKSNWGLLSTVIDLDRFYSTTGITQFSETFQLALRGKDAKGAQGQVFYGDEALFHTNAVLLEVSVPSGSWQLAMLPTQGWAKSAEDSALLRIILLLIILAILIPIIISVNLLANRHDSDLKFRGLFELSPVGIALNRFTDGKFVETNTALENMLGYSADELHGKTYLEMTPPVYEDHQKAVINSLKNYGRYGPHEKEFIRRDGTLLPVIMNGMLVTDSNGEELIWSIVEDITSRKQAELALAQNRKQLEQIIDSTSVAIWDWNILTGEIVINERWAEIIGYSLMDLEPCSIDTWTNFTHPEDLDKSSELLNAHWNGESNHYQCEARMHHKDGHWVWVLDSGKVIEWTSDGKPLRMVGTHLDITEQKESQRLIEQSQIELKNFFDLSPNFMCIIDREGFFERINDTFLSQLDFTRDAFFSCKYINFVHPDDREITQDHFEKMKSSALTQVFSNRYMHSNGDYLYLQWHTSADPVSGMVYATALDITNQKLDEKRMARQQEMLLSMSEQGRIGAWEANLQEQQMYWSTMTKDIHEVDANYTPHYESAIDFYKEGESRETISRLLNLAIKKGIPASIELPIITAKHNERWVSVTVQPEFKNKVCVRLFGSIQDIDSRKRIEQGVQLANTKLEKQMILVNAIAAAQASFIQQTDIAIAFRNLLGGVLELAESEYGFVSEILYTENNEPYIRTHAIANRSTHDRYNAFFAAQGENPIEFFNLDSLLGAAITSCKPVIANSPTTDSRRAGVPDGHPQLESYLGIPIILNGSIIGLIGLANNPNGYNQALVDWLAPLINTVGQMIENTRAIRERDNAQQALVKAKNAAELAARTKSEFLAMMSHEIRTPLNGVLGMLNLVKRTQLDDKQRYQIDIAKSSAESLLNLINDILDFSKVDAGKLDLEVVDFNIITLLEDIAHAMAGRALERGNELIIDTTKLEFAYLSGDPSRLRQILVNLIGNAIKFTQNGEVTVTASLTKNTSGFNLNISVADTGIGIAEEKIPLLFSAFTQVDASTTRKYGGTGLGLAICKKLCALMGGDINITSQEGNGSEFNFHILVKNSVKNIGSPPLIEQKVDLSDKTIFIAESNPQNTAILENIIRSKRCIAVSNLSDSNLNLPNEPIDVAFIDRKLLTSMESITPLKSKPNFANTQWLMLTAINQTKDIENYTAKGFDTYLTKPITQSGLTLSLKSLKQDSNQTESEHQQQTSKELTLPQSPQDEASQFAARILLVDDNTVNQDVAKMMLEDFGLIIDVANNGLEALAALDACSIREPYSLILMDCQMPELDGYETTKRIRKGATDFDNTKIPIIAMTANAMKGDKEKCIAAGMDDYLSKPIESDELESMLKLWLPLHNFSLDSNTQATPQHPQVAEEFWQHDELLATLKGREDRLKILIASFTKRIPALFEEFEEATANNDLEALSFIAHSVKGSAGQLKCNLLFVCASELELTAKNGDLTTALKLSQNFKQHTLDFYNLLNKYLA
ncbi:PAS domain S-box protein [Saccharophagus degradans]|uniref:Sensory/regulatory protein RpfC n=1 Tax=Saccharophagus degradans TaxID=86304 RepID=A0AAW7X4G1_9GAMM|nr:PAS domain S-box protein [Saccharophagus degradans]MDO6421511.1 PAS domain S-box protein [Saccharophagus degradans]MDO6608675.1 PAS domain S-box protein [Saccharophagus degradans]